MTLLWFICVTPLSLKALKIYRQRSDLVQKRIIHFHAIHKVHQRNLLSIVIRCRIDYRIKILGSIYFLFKIYIILINGSLIHPYLIALTSSNPSATSIYVGIFYQFIVNELKLSFILGGTRYCLSTTGRKYRLSISDKCNRFRLSRDRIANAINIFDLYSMCNLINHRRHRL